MKILYRDCCFILLFVSVLSGLLGILSLGISFFYLAPNAENDRVGIIVLVLGIVLFFIFMGIAILAGDALQAGEKELAAIKTKQIQHS